MGGGNREPMIVDAIYNSRPPRETEYSDRHGLLVKEAIRIRKLTPKECWRLQGFSEQHIGRAFGTGLSDSQLYKQAGNAVSVPVANAIGKKLMEVRL
jgi:DNA (cytosine-5)-methyltransferase 1